MKKRGQMEIAGLVVIVILITLGMLFMALFALKEDPKKKVFTRKGLAYSTLSALMKTTIEEQYCVDSAKDTPLYFGRDILEDCAANYQFSTPEECGYACKYSCDGKHSCVFFREKASELLNETLGQWNKRYELRVHLLDGEQVIDLLEDAPVKNKGGCPSTRERDSSGIFPLQLSGSGMVKSELHLCD